MKNEQRDRKLPKRSCLKTKNRKLPQREKKLPRERTKNYDTLLKNDTLRPKIDTKCCQSDETWPKNRHKSTTKEVKKYQKNVKKWKITQKMTCPKNKMSRNRHTMTKQTQNYHMGGKKKTQKETQMKVNCMCCNKIIFKTLNYKYHMWIDDIC